jgi:hypothetical protein
MSSFMKSIEDNESLPRSTFICVNSSARGMVPFWGSGDVNAGQVTAGGLSRRILMNDETAFDVLVKDRAFDEAAVRSERFDRSL